ncbi:MAG TPA: RHS repeat-associated core domain-containing protein, partial [Ktedonobacterales bacterium]|nr:RHS repeat-associated core domain-containing protein [Ktedonobacterales bacterium]
EALDSTGAVTAQNLYLPYGGGRYSNGTMPTSKGFTGQRRDVTGLDYYNARYYDPGLGQFTSADSTPNGINRYGYVKGNPETATDPSGHMYIHGSGGGNNPNPSNCSDPGRCPLPPPTPMGYTYRFTWYIGPVSKIGDGAYVMHELQAHPGAVFPFSLGNCATIAVGETCDLEQINTSPGKYGPPTIPNDIPFLGPIMVTHVDATEFTFTVLPGHFDAPGSTITFTIITVGGNVYLQQTGISLGPGNGIGSMAPNSAKFLGAYIAWSKQAQNLRQFADTNAPFCEAGNVPAC